jgi:hypothetical protein
LNARADINAFPPIAFDIPRVGLALSIGDVGRKPATRVNLRLRRNPCVVAVGQEEQAGNIAGRVAEFSVARWQAFDVSWIDTGLSVTGRPACPNPNVPLRCRQCLDAAIETHGGIFEPILETIGWLHVV